VPKAANRTTSAPQRERQGAAGHAGVARAGPERGSDSRSRARAVLRRPAVRLCAGAGAIALVGAGVWALAPRPAGASKGVPGTAGASVAGKHSTVRWSAAPVANIPPSFSIATGPQPKGTGPTEPVLDAYLAAIVHGDWATARAQLCAPLRGAYPTPAALQRAVGAELQSPLTAYFVTDAGASGVAHYQLQGATWGGGPYQMHFIGEAGTWKACGAGTTTTALSQFGWLVKP